MSNALVPLNEVQHLAAAVAASRLFPGFATPESALVLMMLAQAEGLPPIVATQRYDVIQGRPAKKAQAMLTDFLAAGGKVEWHQHDDQACEGTFSHPHGGSIRVRWDMAKAQKAQLTGKDNWKKHPEAMLHARCVSNGVRFVYPAATGGLYDPTEVADFESKGPKLFDKLQQPAAVASQPLAAQEPVDAEIEESEDNPPPPDEENAPPVTVAKPAEQPPAVMDKFAMPTQDTDRLPQEILRKKRKLVDQPFLEQSESDLSTTVATLRELANGAKDPHNKMVLQVYAAIADTCLNTKRKPAAAVAP